MFNLVADNCYFSYDNITYKQIFGTPMGSPISFSVTEMLMDDILEKAREMVKQHLDTEIKVLKKYVDDIFLKIPKGKNR